MYNQASEKILVCVGPSPFSAHVIRAAKKIADALQAEWFAVYVETQQLSSTDEKWYEQLDNNLRLAESLGAEITILYGKQIANELLSFAERKNITQIMIGKPRHAKFSEIWKGSLVDNIVRRSNGISVHLLPGKSTPYKTKIFNPFRKQHRLLPYLFTVLLVVFTTLLNMLTGFDHVNIALLFLLPVLISAAYWGRGPSILASVLSVLSFDIFFIPPVLSITVEDLKYLLSFAIFLLVAVMTGTMANRLRAQASVSKRREARTAALYALSRKIVVETDIEGILNTVINVIAETIDAETTVLLPDNSGILKPMAYSSCNPKEFGINDEIASWAFEHGKSAGCGTKPGEKENCLYIPLKTEEKNIGVLVLKSYHPPLRLSTEQNRLLEAFANLTAIAVFSLQLSAEAQQARNLIQSEKLRTALFNSISHELRTPLASIMGAVTSLLEEGDLYNPSERNSLLQTVNEGALRMNMLVKNLIDMARLESGMMQLKSEWCDIQEIIEVTLRKLTSVLRDRKVEISLPENMPLINVDFVLIEQVITNLIDNAHKYSSPESKIDIIVKTTPDSISLFIKNLGNPISEENRKKVFDKFYRLDSNRHITGTGLGLSICKGIIEAHGGEIWAEGKNNKVIFAFSLPFNQSPPNISLESEGE